MTKIENHQSEIINRKSIKLSSTELAASMVAMVTIVAIVAVAAVVGCRQSSFAFCCETYFVRFFVVVVVG